ncbi:hypothetical protein K466DRAFT_636437 [Polyporus arcularius HHB13444]|uniref:Uncharacterized protein n=1 Tax=Polyporus arcularius HHB13444 TaxID=1314778 RepID=A0A5C3NTQ1_9APHY|nr:hypothetical protein K466DRAFT_636437 [Polyporus arcularius HHB13444]
MYSGSSSSNNEPGLYACQKQDWRPSYHRDECALLKAGNAFQVEDRRKLHDNEWCLLTDNGEWMYARALETLDYDFLAYGRRSPPHDVPPTVSSPAPLLASRDDRPLGFIPTDGALDHYFVRLHRFRNSPALAQLSHSSLRVVTPNDFARSSVPVYPPLPDMGTSGAVSRPPFIVTGDTTFDERRLYGYVQQHGTQAERDAVAMYGHLRAANIAARRKLADVQKARVQGNVKLLAAHLLAAEVVLLLAAGDDPAARFESFTMKHIYTCITADIESRS